MIGEGVLKHQWVSPPLRCAVAAILGALLMTAVLACSPRPYSPNSPQRPPERRPSSLDPLTAQEEELAVRTAIADPRVRELTGGGELRVGTIQFRAPNKPEQGRDDPRQPQDLGRFAAVLLYHQATNSGLRVEVDLRRAAVTEVVRIDPAHVPLSRDDLEEAWALAQRDNSVRQLLGENFARFQILGPSASRNDTQYEVQGMPVRGVTTQDPCWERRCLALLFRQGDVYLEGIEIVVDLTRDEVTVRRSAPNSPERRDK